LHIIIVYNRSLHNFIFILQQELPGRVFVDNLKIINNNYIIMVYVCLELTMKFGIIHFRYFKFVWKLFVIYQGVEDTRQKQIVFTSIWRFCGFSSLNAVCPYPKIEICNIISLLLIFTLEHTRVLLDEEVHLRIFVYL